MSLTADDIKKIAHLAKLNLSPEDSSLYFKQLSNILNLVAEMNRVETDHIEPMANPLDLALRLRPDLITETNQRALFQSIAPLVEAGLYLVPKVIDSE